MGGDQDNVLRVLCEQESAAPSTSSETCCCCSRSPPPCRPRPSSCGCLGPTRRLADMSASRSRSWSRRHDVPRARARPRPSRDIGRAAAEVGRPQLYDKITRKISYSINKNNDCVAMMATRALLFKPWPAARQHEASQPTPKLAPVRPAPIHISTGRRTRFRGRRSLEGDSHFGRAARRAARQYRCTPMLTVQS